MPAEPVPPSRRRPPLLPPLALLLALALAGVPAPSPAEPPPAAPAGGAVASPAEGPTPLSPEGLLARLKGKHKLEVEKLFARPDRMTDLHKDGDRVYGDGAEVTNLNASGQWVYRGEKAARVVHPATGRKAAEVRLWYDLNDRVMEAEFDW